MAKKLYYKIGEACKLLEIQPYVLRYWETEFLALEPEKSKSGQRTYSEKDLQMIARIKEPIMFPGSTGRLPGNVTIASGLQPEILL